MTSAPPRPRARDLGIPFDGEPGPLNAITDVTGVTVGHRTLIRGSGRLEVGKGPVRTGVTAILPRGLSTDPVYAATFVLNGAGEMTGRAGIDESGVLLGPIMITNTNAVGPVHTAVLQWTLSKLDGYKAFLPVVGETYDGTLNDIAGHHVTVADGLAALDAASAGAVPEGNVGGGTGMICHEFKGGIGTASRRTGDFTLGVLVQANYGRRDSLRIAGVPIGRLAGGGSQPEDAGSIIMVAGTDAPLLPHQLRRIATRCSLGLARVGSYAGPGSGDLAVAFSTANTGMDLPAWPSPPQADLLSVQTVSDKVLDRLFQATVEATEESIVNALVAAETMTGIDDVTVEALSHDLLREHWG